MPKWKQTELQHRYQKFNRQSKIISSLMFTLGLILLICFIICTWYIEDNLIPVLISVGLLAVWFVVWCTMASKLNSKRNKLHEAAYGKDDETIHSGLFGELLEEFEWNQFEGLADGKVIFAETHNNTIELEILRHKHTFHITIDKEAVYMVMDEETATPAEKEIPLTEMTEVGQIFTAIREFVESV